MKYEKIENPYGYKGHLKAEVLETLAAHWPMADEKAAVLFPSLNRATFNSNVVSNLNAQSFSDSHLLALEIMAEGGYIRNGKVKGSLLWEDLVAAGLTDNGGPMGRRPSLSQNQQAAFEHASERLRFDSEGFFMAGSYKPRAAPSASPQSTPLAKLSKA